MTHEKGKSRVRSALCRWTAVVATVASLAGCAVGGVASFGSVQPPPEVAAPPPVNYGAFLDGPVGQKLSQSDRDRALSAEQDALAAGQRKTWRGDSGAYGFVEPAAPGPTIPTSASDATTPTTDDSCRAFTSTVYLSGRPQIGHGRGCRNPDGSYRVVG